MFRRLRNVDGFRERNSQLSRSNEREHEFSDSPENAQSAVFAGVDRTGARTGNYIGEQLQVGTSSRSVRRRGFFCASWDSDDEERLTRDVPFVVRDDERNERKEARGKKAREKEG